MKYGRGVQMIPVWQVRVKLSIFSYFMLFILSVACSNYVNRSFSHYFYFFIVRWRRHSIVETFVLYWLA